jgi:hypothetical protein
MEQEYEEPELARQLAYEIVNKASGVFLLVRLVVTSLLQGLGNYDVMPILRDGCMSYLKTLRIFTGTSLTESNLRGVSTSPYCEKCAIAADIPSTFFRRHAKPKADH